jgi:hydrogenase maturation protease
MASERRRRMVIGIGNPDRGDDAAGPAVARLLADMLPEDVGIVEHDGETTGLIAQLDGVTAAFLVDACVSGAPAGTVRRFDVAEMALPAASFALSSHGLGLAEAIELARALGHLPPFCVVYAIEGWSFAIGAPLSSPVATAVAAVAARLSVEIGGGCEDVG